MIFADLPRGATVFVDANTLVYYFTPHPVFGAACRDLLQRIVNGELIAHTSTHVITEVIHRMMTIEAVAKFGWTQGKVTLRLRQHPDAVKQLSQFQVAVGKLQSLPMQIAWVTPPLIDATVKVSEQTGLLTHDALIVAIMQGFAITNLASNDSDFDRVPGIQRFSPA